jgi:ATP synthase protein I
MATPRSPQEKQRQTDSLKAVAKYGGMAFQLLGACLAGVFIGKKLDAHFQLERPLWAVFLTIFFMVAALYALYRQLLRD